MSDSHVTAEEYYTFSLLKSLVEQLFPITGFTTICLGRRPDENNVIRYWATVKGERKKREGKWLSLTEIHTGRSRGQVLLALLEEVEGKMRDKLDDDPDMAAIDGAAPAMGEKEAKSDEKDKNKENEGPKPKTVAYSRKIKANTSRPNKHPANPLVLLGPSRKEPTKNSIQTKDATKTCEPNDKQKAKTTKAESDEETPEPSTTGRFNLRTRKPKADGEKDGGGEMEKAKVDTNKAKNTNTKAKGSTTRANERQGYRSQSEDSDIEEMDERVYCSEAEGWAA